MKKLIYKDPLSNLINWIKSLFVNDEVIIENERYREEKEAERNTKEFLRAQKVEYTINREIGEIREWNNVGSSNYNPFDIDVFYMSKQKLIETLAHCYLTLKHVKKKLDEVELNNKKDENK